MSLRERTQHLEKMNTAYWESRATTAELKIKDWSVRSVEQAARIRDLEAENHNLKALIVSGENWAEKGAAAHLAQRIAKAREILANMLQPPNVTDYEEEGIRRALEALEGK